MVSSILLISIIVIAGIGLHISLYLKSTHQFNLIMRLFLIIAIIHSLHAYVIKQVYVEGFFSTSPFALCYGPLLFLGFKASSNEQLKKIEFLYHGLPLLVLLPLYLYTLLEVTFREGHHAAYYFSLYGLVTLSWLIYALFVFYKGLRSADHMESKSRLMMTSVVVMVILTLFRLVVFFTKIRNGEKLIEESSAVILYMGMLGAVFFVYLYFLRNLLSEKVKGRNLAIQLAGNNLENDSNLSKIVNDERYQKAPLPENHEQVYGRNFNEFISSERYLDKSLSLNKLSENLHIPKHHLSQLFNLHFGQTYLQHINSKRIGHACILLEEQRTDLNIDDLADLCGFKSKTTFYRNFKEIIKMTPSEYLQEFQSTQVKFRV